MTLGATAVLAACGGSKSDSSQASSQNNAGSSDNFKAVMVSDTGGIDDKSFNQGAWEGLQEWGKITVVKLKEMVLITFFQKQNLTILQTLTLQF